MEILDEQKGGFATNNQNKGGNIGQDNSQNDVEMTYIEGK